AVASPHASLPGDVRLPEPAGARVAPRGLGARATAGCDPPFELRSDALDVGREGRARGLAPLQHGSSGADHRPTMGRALPGPAGRRRRGSGGTPGRVAAAGARRADADPWPVEPDAGKLSPRGPPPRAL